MPLEIASTPVSAVQPFAKARRMRKRPTDCVAAIASRGVPVAAASPVSDTEEPDADQGEDADDEEVGRQREDIARFAQAAQVADHDDDERREAKRHGIRRQRREGGDEREHARRDTDRDIEDVIHHQRARRDQAGDRAEILACDDVRPAAARIGRDRLAVGDRDEREQGENGERDRHDIAERRRTAEDEDDEQCLGTVRDGGERVRGEDGERLGLRQPLVRRAGGRDRAADQKPLDARRDTPELWSRCAARVSPTT